jgi:hypothetical protein
MFARQLQRSLRAATATSALNGASRITARAFASHAAIDIRQDNPSFVLHAIEKTSIDEVGRRDFSCLSRCCRFRNRVKALTRLPCLQRPVPKIKDDEVLVQISKTGICGSDIHYLKHGRIGDFVLKEPMCLGHESSGVVAQIGGKAVGSRLKEGSRVAIEPYYPCRTCFHCKSGQYHVG